MSSEDVSNRSWYLIYSKPRREKIAEENLEHQGYKTYLPLISHKHRCRSKNVVSIEPLFPRYLFIHLDKATDNWSPIRSTIGVASIVSFNCIPAQVPDFFVSTLIKNENEQGIQYLPGHGYKYGEAVWITEGPMKHCQGVFMAQSGKERVTILLNILGRQSKLTIPANRIKRVVP